MIALLQLSGLSLSQRKLISAAGGPNGCAFLSGAKALER
jgi:hypothetical protein